MAGGITGLYDQRPQLVVVALGGARAGSVDAGEPRGFHFAGS